MKKNLSRQEKAEKKRIRKVGIIVISCAIVLVPVIWFAMIYFETESLVDYKTTEINGDTLSVILTEKTSSRGRRMGETIHYEDEINDTHYGYFLEVYDSAENKSFDKIKFSSPVWEIQETPELRVFPNGTIWMISCNIMQQSDKPGFILKFVLENDKIIESDFKLDEKYYITGLDDNFVILSDGTKFSGKQIDPIFGCTYLDLETEKIVVLEPYSTKSEY